MGSEHIRASTVEYNLTALCLRYLTFECFDDEITPGRLLHSALDGSLSFQDYAAAKWPDHVRAILNMAPEKLPADVESQAALREIETALGDFASRYEDDILHASITSIAEKDCEPFLGCQFYNNLLRLWNHIYSHHEKGPEVRNDISIEALSVSISRNRKLLEDLYSDKMPVSDTEADRLSALYGKKVFKCPKVTCFYFHEGFTTAKDRSKHIDRHDRPFLCAFPYCSIAEFGFASNKDLEKHRRLFHPETVDQEMAFSAAAAAARPKTASSRWECHTCGKLFTRGFHLRNHILSHTGERPFACSECGKPFTRANDCKRHEKIHTRRQ
jgi:hypothetical protein